MRDMSEGERLLTEKESHLTNHPVVVFVDANSPDNQPDYLKVSFYIFITFKCKTYQL